MLKPTNDWIVTKRIEIVKKNPGIIELIPDIYRKETTKFVEIISFGPEANPTGDLKIGDIVIVPEVSGIKHMYKDVEYEMAKEKNFLAIWEE